MDFIDWKIKDWRLQKRGIKSTLKCCVWIFQLLDWISLCRIFIMWWQNIWARRASELVKCLLFIFSSDVAVAAAVVLRGCWLLCPAACIVLCFWSEYLCVWACVAISWDLPLFVGWLNLSECYLFFFPFLVDICFFFPLSRFDSRATNCVFCCSAWLRKGSAGVFSGRSHMCSSPAGLLECSVFHPRWKSEICATATAWDLAKKAGSDANAQVVAPCFFVKRLQHLSFINAADYPDL